GAIDSVNTPLGSIASNVSAAQASLNTANTRTDTNLAKTRTDLATVLTSVTSEQQLASATKSKISQAGTALQTVNDAVTGSIANAQANIDAAVLRAQQSVQSAQTAVANQPLNIATAQTNVDNAATAVQTAQANLDAATLTAPSSGVVASIASAVGQNPAIRSDTGRRYVQILKDGEAVDTDVTFGIANDTVTEVTNGLAEGDLVVLPQSRSTATARPGGGFGGPQVIGR